MALHITPPRAIIFDMDGLLLDSERVMLDLHRQASKELGVPWRLEVSLSVVGVSSRDTDRMLQAAYGPDYPLAKVRQRFMSLYEETIHSGGIPTKPFVHELMDKLDALRIPRAVATSTQRPYAEVKLHHAKLMSRLTALACGDEVTRNKPAPDIYELAASRLGIQPRDCLVLEDSNTGVRAAVSASMQVVMVRDLVAPDADIRRLGVPCVDSLKDVLVAL